jgi:hypothetical protein
MESSYGHRGVFYQSCALASNDMYLIFGHVGIGTTAPTSLLHTNDTAAKTASYFAVQQSDICEKAITVLLA